MRLGAERNLGRERKLAPVQVALAAPAALSQPRAQAQPGGGGNGAGSGRSRRRRRRRRRRESCGGGSETCGGRSEREPRAPRGAARPREANFHGEEVAGCGGNGAGRLGPGGRRGKPQVQPQRQPGQAGRVVEKVKFQAGVHQALRTPVAANAGEWPGGNPWVSPSLSLSTRDSSPFHGAELASARLQPRNLWSRF